MNKILGKAKLTREKAKKELQVQDEGQVNLAKSTAHMSKNTTSKEREKVRARKDPKRKKRGKSRSSIGDASQDDSDEREHSPETPTYEDTNAAHFSKKGKNRILKEREETVKNAVAEFFDSAWKICAERFFISTAPVAVSLELRNTWLRIVEAEWQDPAMREKTSAGNNRIFLSDKPPLPSAYDSWCRGAIEPFPRTKRESFLDPFLREAIPVPGQDGLFTFPFLHLPDNSPTVSSSQISENGFTFPDGQPQGKHAKKATFKDEAKSAATTSSVDEDKEDEENEEEWEHADRSQWNFDLDQQISQNYQLAQHEYHENNKTIPTGYDKDLTSVLADGRKLLPESLESQVLADKFQIVLAARNQMISNDSKTDYDEPLPNAKNSKNAIKVSKRFSPSQCGGNNGSGIFRLINQTTSEALLAREKGPQISGEKATKTEDIVRLRNKGHKGFNLQIDYNNEEEAVVQPLFEEIRSSQTSQRFKSILDTSRPEALWNERDPISQQNLFLKRIMINLHGRFKRQTIRSLTARANEEEMMTERFRRRSSSFLRSAEGSQTCIVTAPPTASTGNKSSRTRSNKEDKQTKNRAASIVSTSLARFSSRRLSSYSVKNAASNPNLLSYKQKSHTNNVSSGNFGKSKSIIGSQRMANVRASRRGRFEDSVQVMAQANFENKRRTDGGSTTTQSARTSVASIEGYVYQDEYRRER